MSCEHWRCKSPKRETRKESVHDGAVFCDAVPEGVASPPLTVIAIHGFGSNEEDLLGLGQHLDLPLRFVAPRGPIELRHAFGAGYAWFEFASLGQPEPDSFHRSVELLVDFVNASAPATKFPPSGSS